MTDNHMDPTQRVIHNFKQSIEVIGEAMNSIASDVASAAELMSTALARDHKILICGNGGSAADAQHFSAEMLNRFEAERPALAALALTTDTSTLTSIANDFTYDDVFAKQIMALGQPHDVLLAITTSGSSPSILRAVEAAHEKGMSCIALNGRDGGMLTNLLNRTDVNILVPGPSTAKIQEVHGIVIHCICDLIDRQLLDQL